MVSFSDQYARLRARGRLLHDAGSPVSEAVLQCIWYDHLFPEEGLASAEAQQIRVISPGWWNHQEGPDFKGAQIEFNGVLHAGDVELHLDHGGWRAHGHHLDSRYDDVILHVVLAERLAGAPPTTSEGRRVSTLLLGSYLQDNLRDLADTVAVDEYPYEAGQARGQCSDTVARNGPAALRRLLHLAGEWRILNKARILRERIDHAGASQAIYEAFLYACGFSHFKHHFRAIARSLPYERARQLGRQDGLVLEAALLQMGGLLPDQLPQGTTAAPHFARLRALRRDHLAGLRSLPLIWRRSGVRPNNNPERRLAGGARFLCRTARAGLAESLEAIWRRSCTPIERRRAFEDLFPRPAGFWAAHCTWAGKRMARPTAPLGAGRIRSIIGNVFVPAALALARQERDRLREERVFDLLSHLPKEPDNRILKVMRPRVLGGASGVRLDFCLQQGLIQLHQDWCEPNPSCRNCSMIRYLNSGETG